MINLRKNKGKRIIDLFVIIKTRTGYNYRITIRKHKKSNHILGFGGYYFKSNLLSINNRSYELVYLNFFNLYTILYNPHLMETTLAKIIKTGGIV